MHNAGNRRIVESEGTSLRSILASGVDVRNGRIDATLMAQERQAATAATAAIVTRD